MAEVAAFLFAVGCSLAGVWLLVAAARKRPVIRIPAEQRHMTAALHVFAALLFFWMPVLMYARRLPWQAAAAFALTTGVTIVYFCIVDVRERRRRRRAG